MIIRTAWTKEEYAFIKENEGLLTLEEFSDYLHRTTKAVKLKMNRLGLSIKVNNRQIVNCLVCGNEINDLIRKNRKFCSHICSAKYNNTLRKKKHLKICLNCSNEFKGYGLKAQYCSQLCSSEFYSKQKYKEFIETNGVGLNNLKSYKKHILKEQDCKCAVCGMFNEWNNKYIVFILDHINGNSTDNHRGNLRLVCPNCDSQLDTYKSKNKGNGRHSRRQRYKDGKSF